MHLLAGKQDPNSAELPPAVPTFTGIPTVDSVKVGNKWISKSKPARKWAWAPFSSTSRTDGALFYHWVRANVEYPDYPYARFDVHLDPITCSEEEYRRFLTSKDWTKGETDQLLEFAKKFELRWPVIHDRWIERYGDDRKMEDLQHRYYTVAAKLAQARIAQEAANEVTNLVASTTVDDSNAAAKSLMMDTAAARALATSEPDHQPLIANLGTGSSNKTFDLEYERERRAHMEALWRRSKEEEAEEAELRKELKQVEAQLRKVKKSGGHILAAGSAPSSRNPSRSVSPMPGGGLEASALDQAFQSTAPTPMPQTPYLQSGRLVPPALGGSAGLNKTLLTRMDAVLEELKVPATIVATKRACDLYDQVRRDVLTLLVLQKNVNQKEGLLQSKRLKLAKMGGNVRAVDEETLLGISSGSPSSVAGRAKAKTAPKPKPPPQPVVSKGKVPPVKPPPDAARIDVKEAPMQGKQPRKPSVKRKRKSENRSPGPPSLASASDPVAVAAAAAAVQPYDDGKQAAKKRVRKG